MLTRSLSFQSRKVKHIMGIQLFCLVTPAAMVAVVLFFFLRYTAWFQHPDLTRLQKTLQLLLGLLAAVGAAGLLFLVPDTNLFVHVLLLGLFCFIDLLALIGGGMYLRRKWQFVGFGLLAAAAIIPVLLLVRVNTLPPFTFIFH